MEERNKFKTFFKDLLCLIQQGNKLVEGLRAILRQGLALLHLLKQALLRDKRNSRPSSSASTPPPIQTSTSILPNIRFLPTIKPCLPILLIKPESTPILLSSKLLSPFSSPLLFLFISISNSLSAPINNSNSFFISLSISASTFFSAIFFSHLNKVNCFFSLLFVSSILFYLFYIFLTFFSGNLNLAFFVFPTYFFLMLPTIANV